MTEGVQITDEKEEESDSILVGQNDCLQWLKEHNLDKDLADKCKENYVTLDLLAMCSEEELKEIIRDNFGIKNILLRKRFIKAVGTLPKAKVNQKPNQILIFMGSEEKEIMESLYEKYTQVSKTVTEIQNQFTYLYEKSTKYSKNINGKIDEQIGSLDKKRETLLNESKQKLIEYKKQLNIELEKQKELQKYYLNAKQQFRAICGKSDISPSNRLQELKSLSKNDRIDLTVVNEIHKNIENDFHIGISVINDDEKKVDLPEKQSKLLPYTLEMSSKYNQPPNTAEALVTNDRDQGCGTNSGANQYIQINFDGYKTVTKMYISPTGPKTGFGAVSYLLATHLQWKDSNNKWQNIFRYFGVNDTNMNTLIIPPSVCLEEKKVDVFDIPENTLQYLTTSAKNWPKPMHSGETICFEFKLTTTAFRLYNPKGYCAIGSWQCYGFDTDKNNIIQPELKLEKPQIPNKQVVELNYTFSMSAKYGGLPNNRDALMSTDPLQGCATNSGKNQWMNANLNGKKFVTHIRIGAPGNLAGQGWAYSYLNHCTLQYKRDDESWDDVWLGYKFNVKNTTIIQLSVNVETTELRVCADNYVCVSHWKIYGCN